MMEITKSMLGMFSRCPEQYRRRYVDGDIIPPGIAARQGSAVHKAAEINHLQKLSSKIDMPLDALQDAARDRYDELILEGVYFGPDKKGQHEVLIEKGKSISVSLAKLYGEELAPKIMPLVVEDRLYHPLEEYDDVYLSGQLDVLTEDFWLPDIKTAARSKTQKEVEVSLDLTMYAGLVAENVGIWPKWVSLEVLVSTKTPQHQSLVSNRTQEDFAILLERIKVVWAQIKTGIFPPCDPTHWMCNPEYCGYYDTCKYVRRR